MRRIFARIAKLAAPIAALFAIPAAAEQAQKAPAAPAPQEVARPALWKVADEDTTIYLFGTVHALPADVAWYRGPVSEAFESSQELVSEVADPDPATVQKAIIANAPLPAGETLRGQLSPDERVRYDAVMAKLKIDAAKLDRFKPWYATIVIAFAELERAGVTGKQGVESFFDDRAKALGRPHQALETADFQFRMMSSLTPDQQKRYLMEVVDNVDDIRESLDRIVDAWEKGDPEALAALINEDMEAPDIRKTMLTDRNRTWADWVKTRLDKPGTVFMAVGAGHLAGPGSLQEQLAASGLTATRLQ